MINKIMGKYIFKILFFSFVTLLITLIVYNIYSFPTGYTGVTTKGDGLGCICHGTNQPTPTVSVFFEGPDSVAVNETVLYKIKVSHGPAVVGGFDAAVYSGIIDTVSADTTLRRDNPSGDLTHRFPKTFSNDTLFWTFKYTAPGTEQTDTLYAVGNSCNNDTTSSNDEWNFSPNFLIRVYNPIGIANNGKIVKDFKLYQNYPNPFNPVTRIKYDIKENGILKISVFDVSGRFISTLKDGFSKPGVYEVEFNGNNLSSGIYFYKIETRNYSDTKTMVLIK
jgi:hypothetical protein